MGRQLSTIIEIEFCDVDVTFVKGVTGMNAQSEGDHIVQPTQSYDAISCKSLGTDIAYCPVMEYELSEPECELDPFHADPLEVDTRAYDSTSLQQTQPVHSTKGRKKRHASLIDKAWKSQQKQQSQDPPSPSEPVYIWPSDLAADWSHYTSGVATRSTFLPVLLTKHLGVYGTHDVHEPSMSIKTKRNRKKSLIDKAASQQRRES
jgi:hypothetical protein